MVGMSWNVSGRLSCMHDRRRGVGGSTHGQGVPHPVLAGLPPPRNGHETSGILWDVDGVHPLSGGEQTKESKNITARRTSYAGGNKNCPRIIIITTQIRERHTSHASNDITLISMASFLGSLSKQATSHGKDMELHKYCNHRNSALLLDT